MTTSNCYWNFAHPYYYNCDGNAISNNLILNYLRDVGIVSEVLIIMKSWFQVIAAVTKKARLPILSLDLGITSCKEMGDLKVLGIVERYSRLTKHILVVE